MESTTRTTPTGRLSTALAYARRGWHVLPLAWPTPDGCSCGDPACASPAKHPHGKLAPHGLKDATTDAEQIAAWWGAAPAANIGVACEPSGLVVLDVDPRHQGDTSLERLAAITGPLDTAVVHTGGGGQHYLFAANGTPILSRPLDKDRYPGLDVKACGGYVVAAGSDHISGGRYRWGGSSAPNPIPPRLLAVLPKKDGTRAEVHTRMNLPDRVIGRDGNRIPAGERNSALTARAGQLRRIGLDGAAIDAALQIENRQRCDPPLSESEVSGIAASIGKYEPGKDSTGHARGLVLFDDVAILSRPEPAYIVAGRIVEGSHIMVIGPSGAGKTFVLISMAVAVASGTPWLGAEVTNPGPVVLVETEAARLSGRIAAAKLAASLPLDTVIGLHVLPMPVNLSDGDEVQAFTDHIVSIKPRLVMIDTLSRCMTGDENSKADTAIVVAHTDQIRERTGAAALWCHHTNAADTRERGSTNLRASCDTMLALSKTDDLLTVSCEKQRDADPFDPLRIRLVPVPGTDSCAVRLADSVLPASGGDDGPMTPAQRRVSTTLRHLAPEFTDVSLLYGRQLDAVC